MKRVPKAGLVGGAALREAAAGSFGHVMGLIERRVRAMLRLGTDADIYGYVAALFPDTVVVNEGGRLMQYDWRLQGDTDVDLSNPRQVVETFRPVAAAAMVEAQGAFIEAAADGEVAGLRWEIRVIRAGMSGNGNYYSDACLREAVPLFDGCRVFVKGDAEHLAGGGKDFRNLIGRLTAPRFIEGRGTDAGEVRATFEVLASTGIAARLREAWDRGMANIFGFSVDAVGAARAGTVGGRAVRVASKFTEVRSVDLIVEPGAGGEVVSLIEALSEDPDMKLRERIQKLIETRRPDLVDRLKPDMGEEELETLLREALAPAPQAAATEAKDDGAAGGTATDPTAGPAVEAAVAAAMRLVEARAHGAAALAASNLPEAARKRLSARFAEAKDLTPAAVDAAIKDERAYLAPFAESGRVHGLGDFDRVTAGESRAEKTAKMLDAFFDPKDNSVISLREAYIAVTGDRRVTGSERHMDMALYREALGSDSFASVLGDAIARRLVADYRAGSVYGAWRAIASVVPVTDFRTQHRVRFGGYGDLPTVAERNPYLELASPTDEEATYKVAKRGGTETVTLEMIRNDDVGAVQRIPVRLSRSAQRTLGKFVFDFIKDNPTIYDSVALFHATHGNLGATALDATTLAAGRLAMLKQTEKDSGDRLGIGPRSLVVPVDLQEAAVNLFNRNTNNDKTFVQDMSLQVVPVWYWTDANDWALAADPADIPTIEVAFLDGNEEPELFVQDQPNQGSVFSNDQITYKLRHIYGGAVIDYRGLYKAVVA